MSNLKYIFRLAVLFVAMSLLATDAVWAQREERLKQDFELGRATEILANLMREYHTNYVDEVDADRLLKSAVDGLVGATDPYSEYLSERAMADFEMLTTGKYGGVGSLIRKRGDYVVFAQPYKGTPSDEVGVKIGDKILAIEGEDMRGVATDVISSRLKGDPGTEVSVTIERNINGSVDTLKLKRRRISIPSVPYAGYVAPGIGYIVHNDFIEGSYDEVRRALDRLTKEDSLRGLILDYRSNGGGLMQEAVDIASLFVPYGERIVSIMGRDSSSLHHYDTRYRSLAEELPIVILVSGSSASASEILAGAMQDADRGVIMGQRTYGKGLVQGTRPLGYGTYLKYTTAKYYIPSGRCIQAVNYSKRRSDGSVESVPDSLISEFKTRGGRKVYDGGGIVPDVRIEPQYVSRFALTLYAMGYMEDWADGYMRRNHDREIDVRRFSITDEDYADFCRFIEEKDVPYESETRHQLKALERAADNDRYNERLKDVLKELDELVKDDKMSNMETYRPEIIEALNAEIILRYAYSEGVQEYAAVRDSSVLRAAELLQDTAEYRRILREQHLPMH
ncbi:MAG: S41 family peptidase [Alistipes sp.]|nr:S41 family peptidase [Alistipes sp.]